MDADIFKAFAAAATESLEARVTHAQEKFGVGAYERYDCDLQTGRFWWSDAGVPKVEAKLIAVGSVSTESHTWLWSWANASLEGMATDGIELVRAFGKEHSIEKLTNRKWPADEVDGWEMTAVAARLLETEAAYRCPSGTGYLYLLLNDLRHSSPNSPNVNAR